MPLLDNLLAQADLRTEADACFGTLEGVVRRELKRISFPSDAETGYGPHTALVPTNSLMPTLRPAETGYTTDIGGCRFGWMESHLQRPKMGHRITLDVSDGVTVGNVVKLERTRLVAPRTANAGAAESWTLFVHDRADDSTQPFSRSWLRAVIPTMTSLSASDAIELERTLAALPAGKAALELRDEVVHLVAGFITFAFTKLETERSA